MTTSSNCGGCRYWSEMIARAGGGTTNPRGDTEALCLGSGANNGKYTTAEMCCPTFKAGPRADAPAEEQDRTFILAGGDIGDVIFTLLDGPDHIIWNVTRIQRAADEGFFGKPATFKVADLPPTKYDEVADRIDIDKVQRFKSMPEVLAKPLLAIGAPAGSERPLFCFCDGQHRITARQELGLETFQTFIVPAKVERRFRITQKII